MYFFNNKITNNIISNKIVSNSFVSNKSVTIDLLKMRDFIVVKLLFPQTVGLKGGWLSFFWQFFDYRELIKRCAIPFDESARRALFPLRKLFLRQFVCAGNNCG